jgi:hypothetical protein
MHDGWYPSPLVLGVLEDLDSSEPIFRSPDWLAARAVSSAELSLRLPASQGCARQWSTCTRRQLTLSDFAQKILAFALVSSRYESCELGVRASSDSRVCCPLRRQLPNLRITVSLLLYLHMRWNARLGRFVG